MRITTPLMFDLGMNAIRRQQSDLVRLQQQLSTGRRVLAPSDDPVASSRAVVVAQSLAATEQFTRNQTAVLHNLNTAEAAMAQVTNLLTEAKTLAVSGGNTTLTDADRTSLAQQLRGSFGELLAVANTHDGAGEYLFSGYRVTTQPFSGTVGNVTYNGDAGQSEVQVSPSRAIAKNFDGANVFEAIKNGNGVFVTGADVVNTGSAVIGPGDIYDVATWNSSPQDYQIQFSVSGAVTTYSIIESGVTLSSGSPYTSGAPIDISGARVEIKGAPANGDTFSVQASSNQSIFATLNNLIQTLEAPVVDTAARAKLQNGISRALTDLDRALDHTLSVRTQTGAWLSELDTLNDINESVGLLRQTELSGLQDLDYAKAISEFTQRTTVLEAAQKSYVQVTQLSLFEYL